MAFGRRDWLKMATVAAPGLAMAELASAEELHAATLNTKLTGAREFTTACNFCSCGCGMVCSVKEGKLVNLEGDPDHVVNQGSLCAKGAAMKETHLSGQRATQPLYRAPGASEWTPISWDDAYAKLAKKIKDTRDANWIATEKDPSDGHEVEVNRTDAIGFLGGAQNIRCYGILQLLLGKSPASGSTPRASRRG
jgi:formate dehydrogenase major subunit